MAELTDGNDPNNIVTSRSFTAETIIRTQLPFLPFEVVPEILCRLPVKLLGQLRCLCKFFNSLISDSKFAKKHLQLSTKRHHLMIASWNISRELVLHDSPIPSVFSSSTIVTQTQLYPPINLTNGTVMCSCDGIFCCFLNRGSYLLWNPSIRKSRLLPPLENHRMIQTLCFGYDHFIDNYKIVVVVYYNNEVSVITLGTYYWRRIERIPYSYGIYGRGVFVSGTINWLAGDDSFILSLDLEKESYQQLLLPDSKNDSWALGVLRDCLCLFATADMFLDVWIMNEYGNNVSWTKLCIVPHIQDQCLKVFTPLYIYEDDQLLVRCIENESGNDKLVVYNPKTGTSNISEFQNNYKRIYPNVYIESLISP